MILGVSHIIVIFDEFGDVRQSLCRGAIVALRLQVVSIKLAGV